MVSEIRVVVSEDERKRIEDLAHLRGFDSSDAYLRALVKEDMVALGEPLPFEDEEDVDIRAEFKQAWGEAMRGETLPIEELWKARDEE